MLSGATIRAYRQTLGMTQRRAAGLLRCTQANLSQIESGRTRVSEDIRTRLEAVFGGSRYQPTLKTFMEELASRRRDALPLVTAAGPGSATLLVRSWRPGLDLRGDPAAEAAVGAITVPLATAARLIAIKVPGIGGLFPPGEIVVCALASSDCVRAGDTVLIVLGQEDGTTDSAAWAHAAEGTSDQRQGLMLDFGGEPPRRVPLRSPLVRHILPVIYRLTPSAALGRIVPGED